MQVDLLQDIGKLFKHFGQAVTHFRGHVIFVQRQFQIYDFEEDRKAEDFPVRTLHEVMVHLIFLIIINYGRLIRIFAHLKV